jgi:hypothetical protein
VFFIITTAGWPGLAAQVVGATSRLLMGPAIAAVMVGGVACAGAILWRARSSGTRRASRTQASAVDSPPSPRPRS